MIPHMTGPTGKTPVFQGLTETGKLSADSVVTMFAEIQQEFKE